MVNGHLEDSLRREIESYLESRLSAVKQEITTLQSLLNESLSTFLERQADVQMEGSLVASITEHLHAAHERGHRTGRFRVVPREGFERHGHREVGHHSRSTSRNRRPTFLKRWLTVPLRLRRESLSLSIKGEQATGWRGRGFEGTVGDDAIQQISRVALNSDTVVGSAAKVLATWSGGPGSHSEDHLLLNRLGEEPAQRIVAIPLAVRGRAVAVLYADSAGLDSESINLEALETPRHGFGNGGRTVVSFATGAETC